MCRWPFYFKVSQIELTVSRESSRESPGEFEVLFSGFLPDRLPGEMSLPQGGPPPSLPQRKKAWPRIGPFLFVVISSNPGHVQPGEDEESGLSRDSFPMPPPPCLSLPLGVPACLCPMEVSGILPGNLAAKRHPGIPFSK
mmetsp:Transcript_13014/g.32988  ORF Transcript_13014/g.32988 Transcript_13014/m.32988 type:complete len:140 (-) Transcript_13014:30-449(-)